MNSYQDLGDSGQLFVVTLTADATTTLGEKPLSLSNNSTDAQYPVYGVLEVVAKGSLPASANSANTPVTLSQDNVAYLKSIL